MPKVARFILMGLAAFGAGFGFGALTHSSAKTKDDPPPRLVSRRLPKLVVGARRETEPILVSGQVLDHWANPVAGAYLEFGLAVDRDDETMVPRYGVQAREDGRFVVRGAVPPGVPYFARVVAQGIFGEHEVLFSVGEEDLVISVYVDRSFEGPFEFTKNPFLRHARMVLARQGPHVRTVRLTWPDENFRLKNLPLGRYAVNVWFDNLKLAVVDHMAILNDGKAMGEQRHAFTSGTEFTRCNLRVLDPEGFPVRGARVVSRQAGEVPDFLLAQGLKTGPRGEGTLFLRPDRTVELEVVSASIRGKRQFKTALLTDPDFPLTLRLEEAPLLGLYFSYPLIENSAGPWDFGLARPLSGAKGPGQRPLGHELAGDQIIYRLRRNESFSGMEPQEDLQMAELVIDANLEGRWNLIAISPGGRLLPGAVVLSEIDFPIHEATTKMIPVTPKVWLGLARLDRFPRLLARFWRWSKPWR